jgi:hypothetical protein
MLWKLHSKQSVSYHNSLVTFKHGVNKIYLSKEQFHNFHDACQIVKMTSLRIHLLIDKNIWLHSGNSISIVIHDRGNRFFRFSPNSWKKYIRSVHSEILYLVKYGDSSRGQRCLYDGKQFSFRRSMAALQSNGDKILPRETTHAQMETTDEWEDSSNISEQKGANYRQGKHQRGERYARSHHPRTTPSPGRTIIDNDIASRKYNDNDSTTSH